MSNSVLIETSDNSPAPDGVPAIQSRWIRLGVKAVPGIAPGKGRGLFAAVAIGCGEIIDRACTVPLDSAQCDALEAILPLGDHYFGHPADADSGLIVLGLPSLCNHADSPNAEVVWRHENGLGWIAELTAQEDIAADAEITRRYRCRPWFEITA